MLVQSTRRLAVGAAVLTAMVLSACGGCQRDAFESPPPTLAPLQLDFGMVREGDSRQLDATLTNPGVLPREIAAVEIVGEGFVVAPWSGTLSPESSRTFGVTFQPQSGGEHVAQLRVRVADEEPITAELRGVGVAHGCTVAPGSTVAFGSVGVGASSVQTVSISNPTPLPFTIKVAGVTGSDAQMFVLAEGSVGTHEVPAQGRIDLPVTFAPSSLGSFSAFLTFEGGPTACNASVVTLEGRGVESELQCTPQTVGFGVVFPGQQKQQSITCRNVGSRSVAIRDLAITGASAFTTTAQASADLGPGGELVVPVTFAPVAGGLASAVLNFRSSIDDGLRTVSLNGFGGGPDIETSGPVAFGTVGLGTFQFREIEIRNVGLAVPGSMDDHLRLEGPGANGDFRAKMPELVEATSTGEFVLELPPQGYAATGIEVGKASTLRLRFSPISAGLRAARVLIYSNDPDEPVAEVPITASAEQLPPCDVEVLQPALDFGTVEPAAERVLTLRIRNLSKTAGEVCHLSQLELRRGSSPAFELVNGPAASTMLQPGEVLVVPVRFRAPPAANTPETGTLSFYTSSPAKPMVTIPLTGRSGPTCLVAHPELIDFGTVPVLCGPVEVAVELINLCESTTLALSNIETAPNGSPAIWISQRPSFPFSLPARGVITVKISYLSDMAGSAWNELRVTASNGETLVAPIFGRAEPGARHVERFTAGGAQRDVMLVLDDSGSAASAHFQSGFAQIGAFLQGAVDAATDYRLAVTTTSVGACTPDCLNGQFVNGPASQLTSTNPRILTPLLPDSAALLQDYVRVQPVGNLTEAPMAAAALAVSEPNLSGVNAGFRRSGVPLHVVVMTDAADKSPMPTPTSLAILRHAGGELRVSGVVPTGNAEVSGCNYDGPVTVPGPSTGAFARLLNVIRVTGGRAEEICTADWTATLTRLGEEVFGPKRAYTLLLDPGTSSPMEVKVDGSVVPEVDGAGVRNWSFDAQSRKVEFTNASPPSFGSTVEVEYSLRCGP